MVDKRFYTLLPNSIKNDKRKKASSIGPDLLYEPANMEVIEGIVLFQLWIDIQFLNAWYHKWILDCTVIMK
jgi:hypothetical protein